MIVFIACISLFILLAAVLIISYAVYRKTFFHVRRRAEDLYRVSGDVTEETAARIREMIAALHTRECETVELRSHDGLRLFARYYHVCDGAPLQIQFHGYRSHGTRDFCGGNPLATECGHNTLVVDQRAHGESDGHTIAFGILERSDCLLWVEYACRRFGNDTPIFLSGVSMGAATVLMATALPLPSNVVGVIADCPYSSPKAIIRKVMRDMGLPVAPTYPFVCLGGWLFGHIRGLSRYTAEQAVKTATVPTLLIHGEADRFVPCDMSRAIASSCASSVRLELFPNAGHAMCYMTDSERYRRIVGEFTKDCLKAYHREGDCK